MLVFRELKKNLTESSCPALGVFDGVHLGHQKVILNAVKKAQELESVCTVVTFSKHPRCIISKSHPDMITSLDERLAIFKSLGVGAAVVLDFDEHLAKMSAKQYLEDILIGCLNAKSITIGYNHKFGQQSCKPGQPDSCIKSPDEHEDHKQGDSKFLEEHGKKFGFEVSVISPVKIDNHVVSSSAVRKFILKGDMESAAKFLGRNFQTEGLVVHGQHLGKTIGFPTANLSLPDELIIPLSGVYCGLAEVDSKIYQSVINVGKRPTIGDLKKDLIEAHILNFDENIYGKNIKVSFLKRIRDEQKFNSIDELKAQIEKDCEFVKNTGICKK